MCLIHRFLLRGSVGFKGMHVRESESLPVLGKGNRSSRDDRVVHELSNYTIMLEVYEIAFGGEISHLSVIV